MSLVFTSYGEIIDKYTILLIKKEKITNKTKLDNVQKELDTLSPVVQLINLCGNNNIINELKQINIELWEIEDNIRIYERNNCFDKEFIALARNVYIKNDKRAAIKYEINRITCSPIVEEKSYI